MTNTTDCGIIIAEVVILNFILTKFMYPIKEKMEILEGYYFDNPRTADEIKYVEKMIRKATPFPPSDKSIGKKGYITLDYIIHRFKTRYEKDEYVTEYINNCKYKDPCYKVASMWVILRLKEDYKPYEYEKVVESAKNYIDTLTLLSFEVYNYVDFSILAVDEFYDVNNEIVCHQIQNSLLEIIVEATRRKKEKIKKEEYRFNGFKFYYENVIKNYQVIKSFEDKETIEYITESIQFLRKNYDLKMKFVSIVSIIELLLTHSPDSTRFNVEDSITKQFKNKVSLIVYLNDQNINHNDISRECKLIYNIRSDIAHGNFKKLDSDLKKYFVLCKELSFISIKEYDKIYTWDKLINRTLRYMVIIFKMYLDDYKLLEILKEI